MSQVRCRECNRGATYRRIEMNPWFWIRALSSGEAFYVCGFCIEKVDPDGVDRIEILLGDSPESIRYRHLELAS